MPRNFFRFPSREHTNAPPTPPPKKPFVEEKKNISPPIPLISDTIRARRVTSPMIPPGLGGVSPPKARLPHRASASDSFAQGSAWRAANTTTTPTSPPLPSTDQKPKPDPSPSRRPLRRSKGHQPIADERERRTKAESLLEEHTKLRNEINTDTIRLNRIQKMQQDLRNERQKVENEKQRLSRERIGANYYSRSQSTPVLPPEDNSSPYVRGRANARSNDSFQSTTSSNQEQPDYRKVWSRTPSVSSTDRSPPLAPPHWQRVEQARRERERERAMQKLAEARALEKKAYAEAWGVYESRWMLLTFATRSSPVLSTNAAAVSTLTLSFNDIPWPLLHPPLSCIAITTVAIKLFLAEQATDKSQRDRIKEALLRWHPDRFSRIMEHVRMDSREEVKKGVDIVVRCLNELLSKA